LLRFFYRMKKNEVTEGIAKQEL